VGPLARSAEDLATVFDALQGDDPADAAYAGQPPLSTAPLLHRGVEGLRVAVLGDYFEQWAGPAAREVVARAAAALGAAESIVLPGAREARAAAYVITAAESGAFYLEELRRRPEAFEPLSRERLMAGALLPSAWYLKAQRFRRWFHEAARQIFAIHDVLIAPATPCTATPLGAVTMDINGTELPLRPSIGLLTQPISLIGLPVAVAPLWTPGGLPLGVQLIAPPWREDLCLRAAWALEEAGLARAPVASRFSAPLVREDRP
jgi:Asp-tRNA(Asn)/Glu-tRNA(Gln) amidotransferase A subunit family amidase